MAKIAVVIDDWFEDSEYIEPVSALRGAGHAIVNIGLEKGKTVTGKKKDTPVSIEQSFEESDPRDFDALLIPGGFSPDRLRAHNLPVAFVKKMTDQGKPVFAICHGPQLLISAGRLKGKRVTGYASIVQDLKNAGARFVDAEAVVDGNLLTSRQPGDLPAFIQAALEMLAQQEAAETPARASKHSKREDGTLENVRENWWTC